MRILCEFYVSVGLFQFFSINWFALHRRLETRRTILWSLQSKSSTRSSILLGLPLASRLPWPVSLFSASGIPFIIIFRENFPHGVMQSVGWWIYSFSFSLAVNLLTLTRRVLSHHHWTGELYILFFSSQSRSLFIYFSLSFFCMDCR